jgi:hypothetical protein
MRLPVDELVSRAPVPSLVQSAVAAMLRPVASYADAVGFLLDQAFTRAIAEVVRRVDVNAVVQRVDLDAIVQRIDIDAVLDRIDLTQLVLHRVDLAAVIREALTYVDEPQMATLAGKIDVDEVARRIDFDAVLDEMDLTTIVLNRVDLIKVVDAVLGEMDLIALANQIIEGVDLPEIIRDSTGSMASETVKGARMQGIGADQAVGRAVDRLLLRRGRAVGTAGS